MYPKSNDYLKDSILTASPTVRLMMLLDRLSMDMKRAEGAFEIGDIQVRNACLTHAQEIVLSLRDCLRVDLWEGGAQLSRIYGFIYSELVFANINSDVDRFRTANRLLTEIITAWHKAAQKLEAEGALVGLG